MRRSDTTEVRVVAGLFWRGDRVLVQQRPDGKARGSLWELPGGKVEVGEEDATALARECREELRVDVEVGARLWETRHRYPDLCVYLLVYAAELRGEPEPRARDVQRLAWVEPPRLTTLAFCDADLPFIRALASGRLRAQREMA